MRHEYDRDESTRDELRAQIRFERRTAWRRALDPRDPEYYGDPEDFADYDPGHQYTGQQPLDLD